MEKFLEYLSEAQRIIRACDHMVYVSFPLIKDKKLLIKIVVELQKAVAYCINAILQYEYVFNKIKLYKDAKTNFKIFINQSSKKFDIKNQEIKLIINLFEIVNIHKKSSMEFTRNDKIVILSENMKQQTITLEKTKEFLSLSKIILEKTKNKIYPNS
jgi:hypothetical protein